MRRLECELLAFEKLLPGFVRSRAYWKRVVVVVGVLNVVVAGSDKDGSSDG